MIIDRLKFKIKTKHEFQNTGSSTRKQFCKKVPHAISQAHKYRVQVHKDKKMNYAPMLAKIGKESDLTRDDYIFEPKLDGYRAICIISKTIKLLSRRGKNIIHQFPEFDFRNNIKAKSCVLDGEIIVYDNKGNPNFNLMQQRYTENEDVIAKRSKETPAVFAVFDILMKDGKSLVNLPLMERKKILKETIKQNKNLQIIPWTTDSKKLWREMKKRDLEGVMAKEKNGLYKVGARSNTWLKVKFQHSIECIIVGFTTKNRQGLNRHHLERAISSLALGLFKDDELHYVGKVGTGFDEEMIKKLDIKLTKIVQKKAPVINPGRLKTITWVKPKLVCEIKYQELTKTEHLRIPVFLRMRDDKKPHDCTFSQFKK